MFSRVQKDFLHRPAFHILLIFFLGILAYSNTFHVPFHFDDVPNIVENLKIRNLSAFWPPSDSRWFGFLTFALNYKLQGLNVIGYHVVNFAIHIINSALVYFLVVLSFQTPYLARSPLKDKATLMAFFSGLLFAVHPIQTQAVTYIVQRLASLATLLYLLSLVMYIKARLENQNLEFIQTAKLKSILFYLSALFSAALAMKTKEISFTLPAIVALYEFMFFGGSVKRRLLYLLPLFLTMLIIPLTLLGANISPGELINNVSEATRVQTPTPRWVYLLTQFRVIVTYIRLLFFPINQNLDYDYPIFSSFSDPSVFMSCLLLLSISGLGIYLMFRSRSTARGQTSAETQFVPGCYRLASFGIFWFFITLSVESSIIPIRDVIYEHRLYLPSVGAFIAITIPLFSISGELSRKWPKVRIAALLLSASLFLTLSVASYVRNIVWRDPVDLWENVVQNSPAKARGHYWLGTAYYAKGWDDKAIEQLLIALRIASQVVSENHLIHDYLGFVYEKKGWLDQAIEQYQTALGYKSDYASARVNLGRAYRMKGRIDDAIAQYKIALGLKPNDVEAHNALGELYMIKGMSNRAIEQLQIAIRLAPDTAESYNNLGNVYNTMGLRDNAIEQYLLALKTKPDYAEAFYNLGLTYELKGLTDNARRSYENALRIKPDYVDAQKRLHAL